MARDINFRTFKKLLKKKKLRKIVIDLDREQSMLKEIRKEPLKDTILVTRGITVTTF